MTADAALHLFMGELLRDNPSLRANGASSPLPPLVESDGVSIVSDNARGPRSSCCCYCLNKTKYGASLRCPLHHHERRRDEDVPPRAPLKRSVSLPVEAGQKKGPGGMHRQSNGPLPSCRWYNACSHAVPCKHHHSDDELDLMSLATRWRLDGGDSAASSMLPSRLQHCGRRRVTFPSPTPFREESKSFSDSSGDNHHHDHHQHATMPSEKYLLTTSSPSSSSRWEDASVHDFMTGPPCRTMRTSSIENFAKMDAIKHSSGSNTMPKMPQSLRSLPYV
mmetsp:Transcript_1912/g.4704  ORF Transcript_1912/g.4704 Transcript_1912/m.4704 type:complete len:278 (+) Transcript_1912:2536-3369(+)